MTDKDLTFFKTWFTDYTRSFLDTAAEEKKNFELKMEHSLHVAANIVEIAGSLKLDRDTVLLAETIGLFHDIGRFPQYEKYKTFQDRKSTNHGLLGTQVLLKENVLNALPEIEQDLILRVVKFHSAYTIPHIFDEQSIFFLKMVRDADKVDIYRVFIDYYESPKEERASATAFGVPDTPEYSKAMLQCVLEKRIASYLNIKTEHDFQLMQLSWIYDLNFTESIRLLQSKKYINKLINKLPQTEEIQSAVSKLQHHVSQKLDGQQP